MRTVDEILANVEASGFAWAFGHLEKNGVRVTSGEGAPYMRHTDAAKLTEAFGPEYLLDMANGTSGKVRDQAVCRDALYEDRKIPVDTLKRMVIERALGHKSKRSGVKIVTVTERIYVADDGSEWTDKAEYMARQAELRLTK